jgi:fructokinase
MNHALVIGEALVDQVRPLVGDVSVHPGGSPANVALGLGRLGRDVELLAWLGTDDYGSLVRDHLESSGVQLAHGSQLAEHTSVATANLNADGVAQYDFDLTWEVSPEAAPRDNPVVVHTGSIATVLAPGGAAVLAMVRDHRARATITYDPNARPALMGDPRTALQAIESVIAESDVVKVSDEDLEWLRPDTTPDDLAQDWLTRLGPAMVIVTRGGSGATAFLADGHHVDVKAPRVTVADTVGAGDSFMGGLIDGLWQADLVGADKREALRTIDHEVLRHILTRSARIAAITVSRPGANPPGTAELAD